MCVKVKDYERHYHPDRLLFPHKRVGKKGSKNLKGSWDEAIDIIHSKWKDIISKYGPQAILPFSYLGNQGLVHGLNGGDSFFNKLGATVCERTFVVKVHVQLGLLQLDQLQESIPKVIFIVNI